MFVIIMNMFAFLVGNHLRILTSGAVVLYVFMNELQKHCDVLVCYNPLTFKMQWNNMRVSGGKGRGLSIFRDPADHSFSV